MSNQHKLMLARPGEGPPPQYTLRLALAALERLGVKEPDHELVRRCLPPWPEVRGWSAAAMEIHMAELLQRDRQQPEWWHRPTLMEAIGRLMSFVIEDDDFGENTLLEAMAGSDEARLKIVKIAVTIDEIHRRLEDVCGHTPAGRVIIDGLQQFRSLAESVRSIVSKMEGYTDGDTLAGLLDSLTRDRLESEDMLLKILAEPTGAPAN